ncbi:hypothetical protein ILYODFUR_018527, partial [Ilyodon furcidens]
TVHYKDSRRRGFSHHSSSCQWISGNTTGTVLSRDRLCGAEPYHLKRASGKGAYVGFPEMPPELCSTSTPECLPIVAPLQPASD